MEAYNLHLSAPQFLKLKDKLDKMAYRQSLQHQMQNHQKQRMRKQEEKRMEKSSIDMKYEQEQKRQSVNRYNKMSVQKQYQIQNYTIYNNNKYRQSERRNKSDLQIYNEDNPWVKIHTNDERKSKDTKDNFYQTRHIK